MGPRGEMVLLAVTSGGTLLDGVPHTVARGADHVACSEALWDALDALDPVAPEGAFPQLRAV